MEEFGKGEDIRTFRQVLDHKLTWMFQLKKIGDLVRKGEGNKLRFEAVIDTRKLFFTFGQSEAARQRALDAKNLLLRTEHSVGSVFFDTKKGF